MLEKKYHGESFLNKISKVSKFLKLKDIHYLLTTAVENISWLLNIKFIIVNFCLIFPNCIN
ncbi:MAG: aminopeptidase P family N-terminal domain-containing protein [Candidatus Fonsibacter sp.]